MGRLRPFDLLAGVGGVVLLVSLFLSWYGFAVTPLDERRSEVVIVAISANATGWESFTVIDVLLAAIAALAVAVPLITAAAKGPAGPVAVAVLATTLTPLAMLLVIFRLLEVPAAEIEGFELSTTLEIGAWIALAGALIAFVGSFGALRDESTPGAVPPDVKRRPAPPPAAA